MLNNKLCTVATKISPVTESKIEQYSHEKSITPYEAIRELLVFALEEKEKQSQDSSLEENFKKLMIEFNGFCQKENKQFSELRAEIKEIKGYLPRAQTELLNWLSPIRQNLHRNLLSCLYFLKDSVGEDKAKEVESIIEKDLTKEQKGWQNFN